jgi:hypothetical protein
MIQSRFGLGFHRQNPFHGTEGVSTVAHGPLERGPQIISPIGSQQGQHVLGLRPTVAVRGQQAVQERDRGFSQFGKLLLQTFTAAGQVAGRLVIFVLAFLVCDVRRKPRMADSHRGRVFPTGPLPFGNPFFCRRVPR